MTEIYLMLGVLAVGLTLLGLIKLTNYLRRYKFVPRTYVRSLELMIDRMQARLDELEEIVKELTEEPKTVKLLFHSWNERTGEPEDWFQVFEPGDFENYQAGLVLVQRRSRIIWIREEDLRPTDQELEPFTWERVS